MVELTIELALVSSPLSIDGSLINPMGERSWWRFFPLFRSFFLFLRESDYNFVLFLFLPFYTPQGRNGV